jgi:hypothetical protein
MAAGHHVRFKKGWQDLELALMCETFNTVPDVILRQDARTIRRTHAILLELKRIRNHRQSKGKR